MEPKKAKSLQIFIPQMIRKIERKKNEASLTKDFLFSAAAAAGSAKKTLESVKSKTLS